MRGISIKTSINERGLRQSGRPLLRAASLRGERKALWRVSDTVPEAGGEKVLKDS